MLTTDFFNFTFESLSKEARTIDEIDKFSIFNLKDEVFKVR